MKSKIAGWLKAAFSPAQPITDPIELEFADLPVMGLAQGAPSDLELEHKKISTTLDSYARTGKSPLADAEFAAAVADTYDPTDIYAGDRPTFGARIGNAVRGMKLTPRS